MSRKRGIASIAMLMSLCIALMACSATGGSNGEGSGSETETPPAAGLPSPEPAGGSEAETEGEAEGGGEGGGEAGTVYKFPEPVTFTMLTNSHATWPYSPDWLIWDLIEEHTNVTLDVQVPAGTLEETISLTIASGNLPDLMFMMSYASANDYGNQGALVNILDYIDVMPNFRAWMERYPELSRSAMSADGKMYIFPNEGFGETNRQGWLYRQDVFEKLNLAPPANFDELYEVLKALKNEYPDSYPLVLRGGLGRLANMATAFGTGQGIYYDEKADVWAHGALQDQYRKLLEYMHKFYAEGLIPPDFLTMDNKGWQDALSNGNAFMTIDYLGRIDFFNAPMREQNPEFTMSYMAPPAGPGGEQKNAHTHYIQSGLTVSSTSDRIEDVMRYIDFFYTETGREVVSWGKEGVTYTVENGEKRMSDEFRDISDLRLKTGLATDGAYTWVDYDAHLSLSSPELQAAYAAAPAHDSPIQPRPALNQEEMETNALVGDTVNKQVEENIIRFIFGDRSLEEWDEYVAEIEQLGVGQLVDIYTQAYARSLEASNQ